MAAIFSAGVVCAAPSDSVQTSTPSDSTTAREVQLRELMQQIKTMQEEIDRLTAARNAAGGPTTSINSLPDGNSAGAQLVATYCTQCHTTPLPAFHTAEEWRYVTTRMRRHMEDNQAHVKEPTDGEMKTIIDYMRQFARQPQ